MGETEVISRALALVGMPGSGKSTCAQILLKAGYPSFRFGSIVIEEVIQRGLAVTPENERMIREELRKAGGMAIIAKRALSTVLKIMNESGCVVIDGLYSFSEYRYLLNTFNRELALLAIVAPRKLRYQRLLTRSERQLTQEKAEQRDMQEIEALEKSGPIAIADYTIINDGSVSELRERLKQSIEYLGFIRKMPEANG